MKFEIFIARRYLTKGRKNSFISIISLVSVIGIAIGVAALIIALSLINGFQNDIRAKILSSSAHLMVADSFGHGIGDYQRLAADIRRRFPETSRVTPVVFGTVLIKGNTREVAGAVFRGIDWRRGEGESWLEKLDLGRWPTAKNEILIGRELSLKLGLLPLDSCLVITPQPSLTPVGIMPRYRKFIVSGIFRSGLYEFDNGTLISNLSAAQALLGMDRRVHYLQINLHDLFAADDVARRLKATLPATVNVITWRELNASLYSALKLEKTVLFFTLTLIIVVASLNIVAGLILLVIQKIRDVGILLSCGATPQMIQKIFFIQGGIIGLVGTLFGVVIGLLFCWLANTFRLIRVPSEIYQVTYVPFLVRSFDVVAVVAVSLLISLVATLIPSRRAAAVQVVEAVKYE